MADRSKREMADDQDVSNGDLEMDVTMDAETPATKTPLNMSLDVKTVSACERHVTVTIDREDIERYFRDKFDELAPRAEVPGFRIGRAPRQLVENRFRRQISDQVKASLLMDALEQIGERQDFSSISEPNFDYESVKLPDEGPMTFEFDIEVRPDFEMPQWKGLQLERIEHEFSDEEIDRQYQRMLPVSTMLVPVDEPARSGDYVIANLTSRYEGDILNREEEVAIPVRSKLSLADAQLDKFDKLMKGVRAGEQRTAEVTVVEDAINEEVQGKTVQIQFDVLDVKRVDTAAGETWVSQMGFDKPEEFRNLVRQRLQNRLEYVQRQAIRSQITRLLTESADWELPQGLLRRQARRELERAVMEMRSSGFSESEITAHENRLRHNVIDRTKTMLKEHFILERIAEEENIQDEPGDYDREIQSIADQSQTSPRRVRAQLERAGNLDVLRNMIIERKVIDLIMGHAKFKKAPYKDQDDSDESAAISFAVSGRDPADIPEAKYADAEPSPLSATADQRR